VRAAASPLCLAAAQKARLMRPRSPQRVSGGAGRLRGRRPARCLAPVCRAPPRAGDAARGGAEARARRAHAGTSRGRRRTSRRAGRAASCWRRWRTARASCCTPRATATTSATCASGCNTCAPAAAAPRPRSGPRRAAHARIALSHALPPGGLLQRAQGDF
jgi:hypothetical protein